MTKSEILEELWKIQRNATKTNDSSPESKLTTVAAQLGFLIGSIAYETRLFEKYPEIEKTVEMRLVRTKEEDK